MHRLVFEGRRDVGHAFSAVSLLLTVEDADASTSPTQNRTGGANEFAGPSEASFSSRRSFMTPNPELSSVRSASLSGPWLFSSCVYGKFARVRRG